MKKFTVLLLVLLIAALLVSCVGNTDTVENTTEDTEITQLPETIATEQTTEAQGTEVPNAAFTTASAQVQKITDHLIRFVMKKDSIDPYYTFTDEDIFRFLISLYVYRDDPAHPYGNMVKTDDAKNYYVVSLSDAEQIASEVFGKDDFSPSDYPTEAYSEADQYYYTPIGVGLWTSPFAYEDMIAFERDGDICVQCRLVNSKLYEYPEADYGVYDFVFAYTAYTDAGEGAYLALRSIRAVG